MKEGFAVLLIFYSLLVGESGDAGGTPDDYARRRPGSVYHGRYTRDVHEPELLIPRRVLEDGSFRTYSLPEFYDRHEVARRKRNSPAGNDGADRLHLVLPFNGIDHHVELGPHYEFISPDVVVETRGEGAATNLNDGIRFERVADRQCHYRGFVRGDKNSKAALSLCDGVAGYVHTNRGRYFIEPVANAEPTTDGRHLHMVYNREAPREGGTGSENSRERRCGTEDDWESAWAEQLAKRQRIVERNEHAVKRADASGPSRSGTHSIHRFIELTIVADRRFLDFHNGTDYERYLLTIMNMVSDYYHDSSSGNQIDIVVVRMIYLEKQENEIDLYISPDSAKTLESFAAWAHKMNPADHEHPNHHDVGVLITRYDICSEGSGCSLMGLAYVAAACDPPKAACINEDSGLLLGIVVAHEIGHVMGCSHDTEEISGCPPQDKDESYFIMSPIVFIYTIKWSTCSKKFITSLLESGLGECLNNDPKNPPDKYKLPNMLPGAMYDANFQCNMDFPGSGICDLGKADFCEKLWCKTPGGKCSTKMAPPAEGTKCGENKWCIRKKCVEMGARPSAVNGAWGDWGPTGDCSRTCGGGVKFSERECDKPPPSNGGRYCIGERKKFSICNATPCDVDKPSFRAVQCAAYDTKPVLAGALHKWKPYMKEDENACVLYCVNEANTFSKLSPTVEDGTPCKGGTNDMCIAGICRKVGCDWVIDSDSVEDQCGICNGDGTQCTPVEGDFITTGKTGYVKVVTIPKGARSVHVGEKKADGNTLALKLENSDKYCLNGNFTEQRNGEYPCAGAIAVYNHPEKQREEIEMKGPIAEDVQVQYTFFEPNSNPGIHYKYYTSSANSTYKPKYTWDFVDWSECSAKCGGGTMISEASCIEQQAGKVSPKFCEGTPRPETKSRTCNEKSCGAIWRVSQWSRCSACGGKKGVRRRKVQCVKKAARSDGDDVQANFDACKGKVPKQTDECTGERPCRKMCRGGSETSAASSATLAGGRSIALTEGRRRMMDKFVDEGLARDLEKSRVETGAPEMNSTKKSIVEDFRQLLRDWATSRSRKRKCNCEGNRGKSDRPEEKFTTAKPGSIVKDAMPADRIVLEQAPLKDEFAKSNMSDRSFQEQGDVAPMAIDSDQKEIFRGAEAMKMMRELSRHESSIRDNNASRHL